MDQQLRTIGKFFGRTKEEAFVNAALLGAGCAVIAAIPILIVMLWFVFWIVGLILRLVF